MSKRQLRASRPAAQSLGRRRQARRAASILEMLEKRQLLSSAQPYVWTSLGIGGTGTAYHCTFNPNNVQDMYVETDEGQVWHTTNGGLNWVTLNFQNSPTGYANVNSIQFTSATNTQYGIQGGGLATGDPMVTTNDGSTWSALPGWSALHALNPTYAPVTISADPNSSGRLILTEENDTNGKYDYLYYFSSNGGADWNSSTLPFASDTSGTNAMSIWTAGVFWDTALTGHTSVYFCTDDGLWASNNITSATPTWSSMGEVASGDGFYSFTGSATSSGTSLWAVTWASAKFDGGASADGGAKGFFTGLWQMNYTGTGSTWNNMTDDGPTLSSGTVDWGQTIGAQLYPFNVQMIDDNINDIWIGGQDPNDPIVFESTTGGTSGSWTNLLFTGADTTDFPNDGPIVTSVSIVNGGTGYSSSSPPSVTFSAPTGPYDGTLTTATGTAVVNTNGVVTSIHITNAGNGYTSQPSITIAPPTSGTTATATVYNVEQPNQNVFTRSEGSEGSDENEGWGIGLNSLTLDRSNSAIMVFTDQGTIFETANAGSTTDGTLWYDIEAGGPTTPTQGSFTQPKDDGVQADSDPNYYWNTPGEYVAASSGGSTWQQNAQANDWKFYPSSSMNETAVWDLSFASANDIFMDDTDIGWEVTTNGGSTWAFPSLGGGDYDNVYQSVVDPSNSNTIYAVADTQHNLYTSGFTQDSTVENSPNSVLLMSTNGGVNWTTLYQFPDDAPARTLAIDPNNDNIMMVGTANHLYGGMWETTDLQQGTNATWVHLGDGSGASLTAVVSPANGAITSITVNSGGTGYTPGNSGAILYIDGEYNHGGASGIPIVNASGQITSISITNVGTGYPSSGENLPSTANGLLFVTNWNGDPPTVGGVAPADQPTRLLNSSGTAAGLIATFSGVHPLQLDILNSSSGSTINVVAVMAEEQTSSGTTLDESGIWTGTSTNSGATWTWTDVTPTSGNMSISTANLTINPNVSAQTTWFATVADGSTSTTGNIYETTNSGNSWFVYSNVGQGSTFWIQPGGTEALFGLKYGGLLYTPNYDPASGNPVFYDEQNFPFNKVSDILDDPYNTNQIWVCTQGDGVWETNINTIGVPAIPTNVTVQSENSTSASVSWTENAPTPDDPRDSYYTILASTSSTNWSSAITTSVTFAPEPLGVGSIYTITNPGSGYSGGPFVVTFTGGGGTGATAYATQSGGAINSIVITNPGAGYTAVPTISISGNGSGGSATATITPVPSSATVTGLTPGTVYYFEMDSTDSAGNSAYSNMASLRTDSNAGQIAYEGFNYTAGNLSGLNGGSGWSSGGWTAGNNSTVVAGNLTLANGATAPATNGNYVNIANTAGGDASRTLLSTTVGGTGTVIWAGWEQSTYYYDALSFGNTTNGFGFGIPASGGSTLIGFYTLSGGTKTSYNTIDDVLGNSSNIYFLVARMDFETAGTYINLYVNPTPGTLPSPGAEATWASGGTTLFIPASTWTPTAASTVMLNTPEYAPAASYDEIRLGYTYADVAPGSIPAAPSNLAATPGTNSIALTWTDPSNTSNVTGYQIWRSTDNATWGSSAYATVTGATDSTYTDSSPVSGTTYYYKVDAYNSAGDSPTTGMTCGVATVIAYDGFNYSSVSNWKGGNTGVGFASGWSLSNTNDASVLSGSLSYTNGSSALTTSGNSVQLHSLASATTTLSQTVGATGTTLWVGFEFSGYKTTTSQYISAEVDLGTSTNEIRMGATYEGDVGAADVISGGTNHYMTAPTAVQANTTYFVVYEIQYLSTGNDIISMYADPTLGATVPATATNTLTLPSTASLSATSILNLTAPQSNSYATFDELRLGTKYGSVAPDPLVIGGNVVGATPKDSSGHHRSKRSSPFLASTPALTSTPDLVTQKSKSSTNAFYPSLLGGAWQWTANSQEDTLLASDSDSAGDSWRGLFN